MAGTAFAALGTSSVKAYAAYEQLTGGVDTLFKDSSGTILKYAEDAYKTANLSANQYMETITSFSASLLQGLGGDTEKAAEIGNLAVTDMADNANKMGTAIEAIQNAYQGFAKDNFTMLDNLKLGYGGTAGEMARLVNDSGVMGKSFKATAENVKNIPFHQLVEAIHEVQTEMGITGTTAIEASETISGSWNTLKSSWTNVLTSLASGNKDFFKNSIDALVSSADDFVGNVMGAATNVVEGFGQLASGLISKIPGMLQELLPAILQGAETLLNSVVTALPSLMDVLINVLPMVAEAILTMLPSILQAGVEIVTSLALGIAQMLPELMPVAVDTILKLVEMLVDNVDLLVDAAIAITIALADGLIAALPMLIEKAPAIITKLVTAIVENVPKLMTAAAEVIKKLAMGIIDNLPEIGKAAGEIVTTVVKGIGDTFAAIFETGKNIVMGLWEGIQSMASWIGEKVTGFFGGIVDGVKSVLKIASPSKVFAEMGQNVGQGFVDGIEYMAKEVKKTTNNVFVEGVLKEIVAGADNFVVAGENAVTYIGNGITLKQDWLNKTLKKLGEQGAAGYSDGIVAMAESLKATTNDVFVTNLLDEVIRNADDFVMSGEGIIKYVGDGLVLKSDWLSDTVNGMVESTVGNALDSAANRVDQWLTENGLSIDSGSLATRPTWRTNESGSSKKELIYDPNWGGGVGSWMTVSKEEAAAFNAAQRKGNDELEAEWRNNLETTRAGAAKAAATTNVTVNVQSVAQTASELASSVKAAFQTARWA